MRNKLPWTITPLLALVSQASLAEYEASLGLSLPEDYKTFLISCNGGIPFPHQLDIPNTKHAVLLDVLYGIKDERTPGDLVYELQHHQPDLPEGFLPIGHDPGGSPFLMGTTGQYRGRVYFWDRTWFFKESSSSENTYWLADGFIELLNSLYESED